MLSVKLINETRVKYKYNIKKLKINTRYLDVSLATKSLIFIYFLFNISYLLVFFFSLSLFILFLFILINERFVKNNLDKRIDNIDRILERLDKRARYL